MGLQCYRDIRSLLEELTTFLWIHGLRWNSWWVLLEPYVGPHLELHQSRETLCPQSICLPTARRGLRRSPATTCVVWAHYPLDPASNPLGMTYIFSAPTQK